MECTQTKPSNTLSIYVISRRYGRNLDHPIICRNANEAREKLGESIKLFIEEHKENNDGCISRIDIRVRNGSATVDFGTESGEWLISQEELSLS